jgi:tRNA (guanine-N7-)-methyltransferase
MAKNKLKKFEQNKEFPHFFEPKLLYTGELDFQFKGKWSSDFFMNNGEIICEFGCGKGEYSVELAQIFPDKNIIAFDIKGARMWNGAIRSLELNLQNIAFVRTLIDLTHSVSRKMRLPKYGSLFQTRN